MSTDEETVSVYDDRVEAYADIATNALDDPAYHVFAERLPKNARVLDLGCGVGNYAQALSNSGFRVIATDASAAMIERAAQIDGIIAYQSTFDQLDEVSAFDGIWANFSLLHATRDELPLHLNRIATALVPGGIFHLAMKVGGEDGRDEIGRFYSYYTQEELRQFVQQAGFSIEAEREGEDRGLSGRVDPWLAILAVKIRS